MGSIWEGLGEGSGSSWALFGRSGTLVGASGRSWALLGRSWEGLGLVFGGFGVGLGRVWAGFCSRPARVQVRKQFHMMLPAFACFCLLGHAFARQSVELILDFNSSWLYCLLLLTFACACFGLLCLLWLLALSVPLLLRFCLMLAHFSLLWLIFSIFLRILSYLAIF